MGISRNRNPFAIASILSSSEKPMPSWISRRRGRMSRRKAHMPDWESLTWVPYRSRNVTLSIWFPIRCIPDIASGRRPEIRSPETKSARPASRAPTKSGSRSAGYVRSASSVATNRPRACEKPVLYARPYPGRGSSTTRAPPARAISRVRSRESVSTTRISRRRSPRAARTSSRTTPIEASSFLVGMTTETSAIFARHRAILDKRFPSLRQRLPEQLVPDVSQEGGAQPQEGPEVRPLAEHLARAVAIPEDAVLQGELFPAGPVPEGLPQEIVD